MKRTLVAFGGQLTLFLLMLFLAGGVTPPRSDSCVGSAVPPLPSSSRQRVLAGPQGYPLTIRGDQ